MKIIEGSHLDHGLTKEQIDFICKRFADRREFFIETFELPPELGTVPCGLFGPAMGDDPIEDAEVYFARRDDREYESRLLRCPPRQTDLVTVIAGPHEEYACVLYTAYGGVAAPQESGDPRCKNLEESKAFWAQHALSDGG